MSTRQWANLIALVLAIGVSNNWLAPKAYAYWAVEKDKKYLALAAGFWLVAVTLVAMVLWYNREVIPTNRWALIYLCLAGMNFYTCRMAKKSLQKKS